MGEDWSISGAFWFVRCCLISSKFQFVAFESTMTSIPAFQVIVENGTYEGFEMVSLARDLIVKVTLF